MKRVGNLWPQLTSFDHLMESARLAARGKKSRPDVAQFLFDLEPNICALQRELMAGDYQPGQYQTFWIRDPKPRMISAAPFRDRVVHHALTGVLEPVFERRFSPCSFASRKGYGQHKALRLARAACRKYKYVLKCDVAKYFPSLDHEILRDLLARAVKCPQTLALAFQIVDGSNEQEERNVYYPGDNLFTPFERRRGLPIGNQTSQFFSNVYLNVLDQYVLRELRPALYLRYVDDLVVFGDDFDALIEMRGAMARMMAQLRLSFHEGKSRVYRCEDGLTFLGWRLFPERARLPRRSVVLARRRFAWMGKQFHCGKMSFSGIRSRIAAWLGHASFGNTVGLRHRIFRALILGAAERGRCAGRGLEQQSTERPGLGA